MLPMRHTTILVLISSTVFAFRAWSKARGMLNTCASNMDHTEKSSGLKSRDHEGHALLFMNYGICFWIQCCVCLDLWDGARSCWKFQDAPWECLFANGNGSTSRMSLMYPWALILTHVGTKTWDLLVAVTATWTITDNRFWCWFTSLPSM